MRETPTTTAAMADPKPVHVVIAGAGPGGLLCAINLLRRNVGSSPRYTVTLVETGEDFAKFDADALQKRRSWMIGLAWPGLTAIRRVPELYEKYVSKVGVPIKKLALYLGKSKILQDSGKEFSPGAAGENYLVDRNFIVAALSRYLDEHYGKSEHLTIRYHTKLLFVDPDVRRVFVRAADGTESYVEYDLLVGADGVRSAVRQALVAGHRDFECSVQDIFERFKSLHIDVPAGVEPECMHVFPNCLPNMNGIGLLSTRGINISMGHRCHAPCDAALQSANPQEVADYLQKHFKPFALPDEFAAKWAAQPWQSTTMTHCNFYHSLKLRIALLGDAAHATSPSIGMGMNHALGDAAALDELLQAHQDDLAAALPAYSALRVKEGHALTDVADLIQSYDTTQGLLMTVRMGMRALGHTLLPLWVAPEPYAAIGEQMKLSEAYAELTRMGRLPAIRQTNAAIKQRHFAQSVGMLPPEGPASQRSWARVCLALAVGVALIGCALRLGLGQPSSPAVPPPPPPRMFLIPWLKSGS